MPIRAMGVEPRTSLDMSEYLVMVRGTGVDAAQIYSLDQGHGHRPTRDEIHRYFDDVLRAIDFPAVLSTHQSVGYQVPVPMLIEFADRFDHLIGINLTHQDLGYLSAVIDALGDRLEIHVGGPHLALTALSLGGTGYLSSEGNLAPALCVGVIDAYRENDAWRWWSSTEMLRLSGTLYSAGGIRAPRPPSMRSGCPAVFPPTPTAGADASVSPCSTPSSDWVSGHRGLGLTVYPAVETPSGSMTSEGPAGSRRSCTNVPTSPVVSGGG